MLPQGGFAPFEWLTLSVHDRCWEVRCHLIPQQGAAWLQVLAAKQLGWLLPCLLALLVAVMPGVEDNCPGPLAGKDSAAWQLTR